jgi:branched-chain amino acid transport system substrate-binding protein
MSGIKGRAPRRFAKLFVASAAVLSVAVACGSSDDSSGGSSSGKGLPSTIKVVSVNPTTGVVAFAGVAANKGYELAVKQINDQKFLGDTKLELSESDTKSEPQTAAQVTTQAITDKGVSAIFGSVSSGEAIAMSPLVQKQGLPTIYTQAGSDGVVVGDYTYRATPLMREYYTDLTKWMTDNGGKTIGIIYTEATPTLQDIGSNTLPQMADDLGIDVVASVGTQATTQDFSAPISQILDKKPDMVAALLVGASNPTVMTQLRQAGWTGPVIGNAGAGAGNLKPAGEDGAGMVWPTDFSEQATAQSTQDFVKAYTDEYGEAPLNYAAEAYDAAWFLAKSIKEADSADRSAIKDAMKTVAGDTFDGALGAGLSWKDGDLQVAGAVVEWDGTGQKLLYEGTGE